LGLNLETVDMPPDHLRNAEAEIAGGEKLGEP
jgi:hypothetical protein